MYPCDLVLWSRFTICNICNLNVQSYSLQLVKACSLLRIGMILSVYESVCLCGAGPMGPCKKVIGSTISKMLFKMNLVRLSHQ